MKSIFGLLGLALVGGLVVWVVYSLVTYSLSAEVPEPGGPQVMGGNSAMPDKEMKDAVNAATEVMKSNYQSSHRYRWWSRCADWFSFLLTAAITVIVGTTGQTLPSTQTPTTGPVAPGTVPEQAAALGRKWLRRIGVMAALASVMIAVSSRIGAVSQEQLDRAEKLREVISRSKTDYAGAATPAEGQKVIDNLIPETAKYQ